jgi:glutamyl-tRNA reductase
LVERLALIGVSHRRGGASALEAWQGAFGGNRHAALASQGFSEYVLVETCNRWDLVLHLPSKMTIGEARGRLTPTGQQNKPYAYRAEGALEQLTRIAASLDSLNPGEDQIMAQVREAYAQARAHSTTGPVTSFTFDTALRIAKRVRREVSLAPINTSLFSLARPALERHLSPGRGVAVLGAGSMGTLAAKSLSTLAGVDLTIVNRNPERARQLAKHLSANHLSLAEFLENPIPITALVCTTPVKNLVDDGVVRQLPGLELVVDLGIPRNLDPAAVDGLRIEVLDVDTLQSAGQRRRETLVEKLAQAEEIVHRELETALAEWAERQLGPSIKRLREWYLETIGDMLPPDEAAKLAHKFAHVPIKGLRAVAREHGLEAAKTFLDETGLSER